ncbi:hypothetical protein [Mesorhizobium sp.]|uniref:hypothetical protein n=1 Tax=Mesorhizobium sp. TaxID=1871066 RepID=UPI0025B9476B|nr:hypothetical protein [Mesorhizobium sp.]
MDEDVRELLLEAMAELHRGNADEALLVLERTVNPKFWTSTEAANEVDNHFDGLRA